jgi:tryptophan synthase alpha chain
MLKRQQSGLGLKYNPMNSILEVFKNTKIQNRAALICYLPAGFPDKEKSSEILRLILDNGADMVEVGLPYSDPLMDGPTIQQAVEVSLENKTSIDDCFKIVEELSASEKPVLIMSYYSPIEKYGVDRFVENFAQSNGAGVITPDLTIEEAGPWISKTTEKDVARVFVVAPSSKTERLTKVTRQVTGFVYAASLMGVTGTREQVSSQAEELVANLRKTTDLPIAVGLGVSTPTQAKTVGSFADGVIVGSAFVKILLENPDFEKAKTLIAQLTQELRAALQH